MFLTLIFIILSLLASSLQECIRFEFHEKIELAFGQSDLIRAMCLGKAGKIVDYSLQTIQLSGPSIFNITFHCCAPSLCLSDHDCPINFNCKNGFCSVAECQLTDELEIVYQEGRECFIDDDCYFEIPFDSDNWKCLPDPWCFHNKTCTSSYNFCKRCPTGYIDADPRRFSDGSVQPPTTSSPWWLTPSSQPTVSSELDIGRYFSQPSLDHDHRHENAVPNKTESSLLSESPEIPVEYRSSVSSTPPSTRLTTPLTTPDPITVGYDELSPNYSPNDTSNDASNDTSNTSTSSSSSGFGASDLPVNLSDDELITNVSFIDLTRIDPTDDSTDEIIANNTETPETPEPPELTPLFPLSPYPALFSNNSTFTASSHSSSHESDRLTRPAASLVTANPFAWAGLFDSDLNRTASNRNNDDINNRSTTNIPNFTEINYI